jgi:hypothetical protein
MPIRSSPTLEVEEDGKGFKGEAFEIINHETNIFARD